MGWREHEAPVVHFIRWKDSEGIEHSHTVRADSLDEAMVHIKKVKCCIAAAKAKAVPTPQADAPWGDDDIPETRLCAVHEITMHSAVSKKTGRNYWSHPIVALDGSKKLCFGRAD